MNRVGQFAVFTLIGLSAVACGKSSSKADTTDAAASAVTKSEGKAQADAPKGGSCVEKAAGLCTEYAENPLGLSERACKSIHKGTYAESGCSKTDLIGVCQKPTEKGVPGDKVFYYFGNAEGPWLDEAKRDCENDLFTKGATFTAEPDVEAKAREKGIPEASRFEGTCVDSEGVCSDVFHRDGSESWCNLFDGTFTPGKTCDQTNLVGSCLSKGKVARITKANMKGKSLRPHCDGHWYPSASADAAPDAKSKKPAKKAK